MVSTYKPVYYMSLQDSIASICKTILPFSFKKRRRPAIAAAAAESKQQSDNLKWQQDSYHHMLNLMGLCKEGMVPANEVSAFRTHLLETLLASPLDREPPPILRDKLLFLQELLYAGCISEVEYHTSKRPLLQRLAVQGAKIEARDVIPGGHKHMEASNDEWSDIDLNDEECVAKQEVSAAKNMHKHSSAVKKIKGAAVSAFSSVLSDKNGRLKDSNGTSTEGCKFVRTMDHFSAKKSESKSIFAMESLLISEHGTSEKRILGNKEGKEKAKLGTKGWLIDGLKQWNNMGSGDKEAWNNENLVAVGEAGNYEGKLVDNPIAEGPDTKQIKRKLNPDAAPTDFFIDKVLGDNIKKELARIQREYEGKHPNVLLTDDQIEAISTRLPVDKEDLKTIFPKLWCDKYGDIVLDVVRKEFKEHTKEMGSCRAKDKRVRNKNRNSKQGDENSHPNTFA